MFVALLWTLLSFGSVILIICFWNFHNHIRLLKEQKKLISKHLSNIPQFTVSKEYINDNGNSGIAIDDNRKKVCFITNINKTIISKVVEYKDVLSSEIIEDGQNIIKTSRGGQLGGAILGGVLAGGVGAVIGGLSSSHTSSTKVYNLALQIVIKDTKKPNYVINFINFEIEKSNPHYKTMIEQARYWHSIMSVIINQAETEEKVSERIITKIPSISIADEIEKLAGLLKAGLITDEEFNKQKVKLLS